MQARKTYSRSKLCRHLDARACSAAMMLPNNVVMTNRRKFIKITSAVALALGMAPVTMVAAPKRVAARNRIADFNSLHCANFSALLGTSFSVTESSGAVSALILTETQDLSARFGGENFSLLFRGSLRRPLAQGTYEFDHRRLGAFGLFIVPMRGDGKNAYYEAVFNRIA